MDATPEIGTNVYDRQLWYQSQKKPYLNDPEFQKLSMQSTGYALAEEEQIQYIYNNLHTYKKVLHTSEGDQDVSNYFVPKDGFPQDLDDPADTVEAA